MNLLQEIIGTLSSQSGSLTDALLKTKVLLYKLGHKELVEWVNSELNGYPHDGGALPAYRLLPAHVLVNAASIAWQFNSHPIPLGHLTKKQRDTLQTARMYQSLAVLEKLVEGTGGSLRAPIPMEANPTLGKGLASGVVIQQAWSEIGKADVEQIFVQVRSRLLDFVLGLQDQLGQGASDKDIELHSGSLDTPRLFNSAIFGDNTTIVVGNHNTQAIFNVVIKGDFNSLADEMRQHGIEDADISKLEQAIKSDEGSQELAEQKFGPAVRGWLEIMMSKAINASWQIELAVAGGILTAALQHFYGWLG